MQAKNVLHSMATPVLAAIAPRKPARITAMLRVKNEEDYLLPALESLVELVDEILIIDNLSTDATPEIARRFRTRHPGSVRVVSYPHQIARQGSESTRLAGSRSARRSPNSLATFYDWCVAQSNGPYIMKWDGDMIATAEIERALTAFRTDSTRHVLWFAGANVHADMVHLLAGAPAVAPMEPRLFPKRFARHSLRAGRYEVLHTPYKHGRFGLFWNEPVYLHMQMCRSVPFDNRSAELQRESPWDYAAGELLSPDMKDAVDRFGIESHAPPPDSIGGRDRASTTVSETAT